MNSTWKSGISETFREKISSSVRLEHLKEAFEAQKILQSRIDKLAVERMTDLSLIPFLYAEYNRVAEEYGFCGDLRNGNRKQFFIVLLLLYCPECVFGGQIRRDFCMSVVKLLGLKSRNSVYNMRDKGASWYALYPQFSEEVNLAYNEIIATLMR